LSYCYWSLLRGLPDLHLNSIIFLQNFSKLIFQHFLQLLMTQFVKLELTHLVLIDFLHWVCLRPLLLLLFLFVGPDNGFWDFLAVLKCLRTSIVFFLFPLVGYSFCSSRTFVCVYSLNLMGELLHFLEFLFLLLPLLAAYIGAKTAHLNPLLFSFFRYWILSWVHRWVAGSFFGVL